MRLSGVWLPVSLAALSVVTAIPASHYLYTHPDAALSGRCAAFRAAGPVVFVVWLLALFRAVAP